MKKFITILVLVFGLGFSSASAFEIGEKYIFKTGSNEILVFTVIDKKEIDEKSCLVTMKSNYENHEAMVIFSKNKKGNYDVTFFQDGIPQSKDTMAIAKNGVIGGTMDNGEVYLKGFTFTKINDRTKAQ